MPIVSKRSKSDPELAWFDAARFGMFVHFGAYAMLGRGEWVMLREDIPKSTYEPMARRFNPANFKADDWVDLAVAAGARYITITAKHHDGFCLFDSQLTDYKITNTPFGRDLIGELVSACQRRRMRIVLYYSQPDWHHPNNVHRPGAFKDLQRQPPDQQPDWPAFQRYVEGQVEELVTRYGRIDGIWFDGTHRSEKDWRGRRLYQLIKRHQPHAVVNDRARCGDFFTPERSLPDDLTGYLLEACESISPKTWGFSHDTPLYSAPHLIRSLLRMTAAGGNYLLNIGPQADGTMPADWAARLLAIGDWLRRHGEAVYGTQAGALDTGSPEILATRKDNQAYLHLIAWPATDRLLIPGIRTLPTRARLLGSRAKLAVRLGRAGLEIAALPLHPPDPSVSVLHLTFDGLPRCRAKPRAKDRGQVVRLEPGAPARLPAAASQLRGRMVKGATLRRRSLADGESAITAWGAPEQTVAWQLESARERTCRVSLELGCPEVYAGSTFRLKLGSQTLNGVVPGGDLWSDFKTIELGRITVPSGKSKLVLQPLELAYGHLFADVKAAVLTPV